MREHVTSYEELSTLFALHGAPDVLFTAEDVATSLGIDVEESRTALSCLSRAGLARQSGEGFRYLSGALSANVDLLAEAYARDRMSIVAIMSKQAVERLRTAAARLFAEAFVVKGRKKDG